MKKVSVIVTTFNAEDSVENTIRSIKNQAGVNHDFTIELIVVDDCSTDRTCEILKGHDLILLQTEKNSGGPNCGRNIGLRNASGDYTCLVDHDDVWAENKIATLLPYLEKASIVTSGYTVIDQSTNRTIERVKQHENGHVFYAKNLTFLSKLSRSQKGQNTYLGTIIFRKELNSVLFEEHFGQVDSDWLLRLFHQQESIEVCRSLYTRHVSGENLSLRESYRTKDFYYSLMTVEQFWNDYPKETLLGIRRIHGTRARYYYLMGDMRKARFYFLSSKFELKTVLYYCTTYFGSTWVKRKFNVFG
jgi:glycosyltransferase involved in cell wall biosynthesis